MTPDPTPRHPVRLVAARTGLSPHVLRAWERRYHVVEPARSEGGQRLYSDLDVARLRLLYRLTAGGHPISRLASLTLEELERAVREEPGEQPSIEEGNGPAEFTGAALRAARRLDGAELHALLERAVVTLGVTTFIEAVAAPTLRAIGHGWREGEVSVGQEHLASAVFRRVLGWIMGMYDVGASAPGIVLSTPPGQIHDLGAMLAGATAAAEGWRVTYLGPDLPVADLLAAARQVDAKAVALSLIYPIDGPALIETVAEVRQGLPRTTALLLGGAAATPNRESLEALGAQVLPSLADLRRALRGLAPQPEAA